MGIIIIWIICGILSAGLAADFLQDTKLSKNKIRILTVLAFLSGPFASVIFIIIIFLMIVAMAIAASIEPICKVFKK